MKLKIYDFSILPDTDIFTLTGLKLNFLNLNKILLKSQNVS